MTMSTPLTAIAGMDAPTINVAIQNDVMSQPIARSQGNATPMPYIPRRRNFFGSIHFQPNLIIGAVPAIAPFPIATINVKKFSGMPCVLRIAGARGTNASNAYEPKKLAQYTRTVVKIREIDSSEAVEQDPCMNLLTCKHACRMLKIFQLIFLQTS